MRDFEFPSRSVVRARRAMAATSHPAATQTALAILDDGGNALDAAIAAAAVQCVVEPQSTGIGGDGFALIAPGGSDRIVAYNGSGRSPAGLSIDWFRSRGLEEVPRHSPGAVTIPGIIDLWTQLHADYGRMPFAELLAPAIRFAREGYVVAARVARDWAIETELLAIDPAAAAIFLPGGKPPEEGDVHRQPLLADTLERIAREGRDGFYQGEVAADIVARLQGDGGVHTLADFAAHRGDYVTPVSIPFQDCTVFECPPNGQGIIALLILNILKRFHLPRDPLDPERLHVEIEATRLAYAVRDGLIADPAFMDLTSDELLSDALADMLSGMIDPKRRLEHLPPMPPVLHRDTVYLSIVDEERNAVSFINSVFDSFGSGIVAPKSGVVLQNRGQGFSLDPDHPNCVGPNKRPLHTIIPGMVTRGGRALMPFGVMGGYFQAMGHAHLLTRIFDCGLDLQQAVDLPRLIPVSGTSSVEVESRLPERARAGLIERGHDLVPAGDPLGGAQAILIDWEKGTLAGASEPRKDGCALGL